MINLFYTPFCGFSGESDGKESACNAGDASSIPGSGRYPREGNCNPLQYSCLENPMDRRTCGATVMGFPRVILNTVLCLFLKSFKEGGCEG